MKWEQNMCYAPVRRSIHSIHTAEKLIEQGRLIEAERVINTVKMTVGSQVSTKINGTSVGSQLNAVSDKLKRAKILNV